MKERHTSFQLPAFAADTALLVGCSYTHKVGYLIPGMNIKKYTAKSAPECKALCSAEPKCKAIDYATTRPAGTTTVYPAGACVLNNGARTQDCSNTDGYKNLDVYIKDMCSASSYGKWMSPAIRAAVDYIASDPKLMPGFRIKLSIKDSWCDRGNALADFSNLMASVRPTIITGLACSSVAITLGYMTDKLKVPSISMAAISSALSDGKYFARFNAANSFQYTLAADVARGFGLSMLGGILSKDFSDLSTKMPKLATSRKISSCGCVIVRPDAIAETNKELDLLYAAACRAVSIPAISKGDLRKLLSTPSRLLSPGAIQITLGRYLTYVIKQSAMLGWITSTMRINTDDPMYKIMKDGFDKADSFLATTQLHHHLTSISPQLVAVLVGGLQKGVQQRQKLQTPMVVNNEL